MKNKPTCLHVMACLIFLYLISFNDLSAQNSVKGSWSPVYTADMIPVACANLPNGNILAWSAKDRYSFGGDDGKTYTSIFNVSNNTFNTKLIENTGHDMFCPGIANIGSGEVVITGGSSSAKTTIYNPANNTFRAATEMNTPRGYHAMCTLDDGRVFTVGGSWSGGKFNKNAEVWSNENGWFSLSNVNSNITVRQGAPDPSGIYRDDNHAWIFAAPGGRVFQAGPGTNMHWINTTGQGSVIDAGNRGDDAYAMNGNAVMYDKGKILKTGGAISYDKPENPASNKAYTIDISNGSSATVKRVGNLNQTRVMHNSIVLPNGEVVVTGGQCKPKLFTDECARLEAEIWNPATGTFRTVAAMQTPRNYHSVGILMQDGRVWVAGGGLCGNCSANHPNAEIYSPPYLYNSNNSLATRPVINSAPSTAAYNSTITVNTNTFVQSFVLMRLSSATHSVNNEQRRIPLGVSSVGNNSFQVTIPGRAWVPPGNYFLFALKNGVPSIAKVIKIGSNANTPGNTGQVVADGTYYIEAYRTGQHLASPSYDANNARMVNQGASDDQQWEITHVGNGAYNVRNIATGRYLEVYQGKCENRANITTWTNPNASNVRWIITKNDNEYFFQPLHCTAQAMDYSNEPNSSVYTWGFSTGNNNQRFKLKNVGEADVLSNNIALGKPTLQSSTAWSGWSSRAVDGNTNGDYAAGSTTHTHRTWKPFWTVDLQAEYNISTIRVSNRTDGHQQELNGARILLFTDNNQYSLVGYLNENAIQTFSDINKKGRHVYIQLPGNGVLSLAEVEVQGTPASTTPGRIQVNGSYTISSKVNGHNAIAPSWDQFNVRTYPSGVIFPDHVWKFKHIGNGVHTIQNEYTNRYLDAQGYGCSNGTNLTSWIRSDADNSRWYVELWGSDYYLIPVHCPSHAMDQNGSSVNIHLWTYNRNNNNQKWDIISTDGNSRPRSPDYGNELRATPTFGQQTELTWYASGEQSMPVRAYTFQHLHEDGEDFTDLHQVLADDVLNINRYDFIHVDPLPGKNYYQVKIEFADGSIDYSIFQMVEFDAAPIPKLNIAPNPAKEFLNLNLQNYMDQSIHYFISSLNGEVLLNGQFDKDHGKSVSIDLEVLQNGNYVIYIRPEKGREMATQFVVMKY